MFGIESSLFACIAPLFATRTTYLSEKLPHVQSSRGAPSACCPQFWSGAGIVRTLELLVSRRREVRYAKKKAAFWN
jgi:hypothetical protein